MTENGAITNRFALVKWTDQVALKLRGLPWSITEEDVCTFFENHRILRDSVMLGKTFQGRPNGWAICLFESEQDALKACKELDKEYIGERWINITIRPYREYLRFN